MNKLNGCILFDINVCTYVCIFNFPSGRYLLPSRIFFIHRGDVCKPVVIIIIITQDIASYTIDFTCTNSRDISLFWRCWAQHLSIFFTWFISNLCWIYLFTCQFDFQKHENRKETKNKVKIRKMPEKRNTGRVLE